MSQGPTINNTRRKPTPRDTLGIENVATSIQGEICPVVNTVTPKPYYWAFIDWCYYDWYTNNKNKKTKKDVNKYIRKVNYYIALGNILANGYFGGTYTGSQNIYNSYSRNKEKYKFDESYIKGIGDMNYYPAGLDSMGMIITSNDNTNEVYIEPVIREKDGVVLAKAFDVIIKKTEYYQKYRFKDVAVPKDVLIELGKTIKYDLKGFDDCKKILKENLFNRKIRYKLNECKDYILYVKKEFGIPLNNEAICRNVFYDYFSPNGSMKNSIPSELATICKEWEFVMARQYMIMGLEILWKYMLEQLNGLYTKDEWFKQCLNVSKNSFSLNSELSTIMSFNLEFDEREKIINLEKSRSDKSIENSLKIIISTFNRINNRKDVPSKYYSYGSNRNAISMEEITNTITNFQQRTIKDFILYIMENYLLKQHLQTAFTKMLGNRDGYYIQQVENQFIKKKDFKLNFQGIRMVELYSVMKDLDIVNE